MAFDGIVIANLVHELNQTILNLKISKIAQPESDELLFTLKGNGQTRRLLISASASLPLIYLTDSNKQSPLTAPNFCMVLRKHIANGKITRIYQPHMERIICFEIEHLDEMGDLGHKILIIEIMGKHSNIIFCDEGNTIIDSIKHVSLNMSSVREVLPGRSYFIPKTQDKKDPLEANEKDFLQIIHTSSISLSKSIYGNYTGISPLIANEICYRASLDGDLPSDAFSENELLHLWTNFLHLMEDIKDCKFCPNIVMKDKEPVEFSSFILSEFSDYATVTYDSISFVLNQYYEKRDSYTRIRQKSSDLRKVISNALDRSRKKYALQSKQLEDTNKREKCQLYGELLTTYGYEAPPSAKSFDVLNYYTNEMITIPLDSDLTALENAKKYFEKYAKLKRTYQALTEFIENTKRELAHLESIEASLDIAVNEDDLSVLRDELFDFGFVHKRANVGKNGKKKQAKSIPFHYLSSDGYHIYVGKNNYQNEDLTFKLATGNDWWFHAKGIPGSHVIVKSNGDTLPDSTFEEAAKLAAYYSKGKDNAKVEIDYIEKKQVKKVTGAAPGFVIYHTNYSMSIEPDISGIEFIG